MSFAVFADGSANLPLEMLDGISLLPNEYTVDGVPQTYWGDVDRFDGHNDALWRLEHPVGPNRCERQE